MDGWLDAIAIRGYPKSAATVMTAVGGHPGAYVRGDTMTLEDGRHNTFILDAGTKGPTISKSYDDGQPTSTSEVAVDTYSRSKLDVDVDVDVDGAEMVRKGVCAGCREADCERLDGRAN